MRSVSLVAASLSAALWWAAPAGAAVTVSFVEPGRYTDAHLHGHFGAKAVAATLVGLQQHLEALDRRHLRPDQALTVEVLDVDLAGEYRPWRVAAADVRVMRSVTWPRITLRYVLREGDAVVMSGEEAVVDLEYLTRSRRVAGESLGYEKAMLDDWFRARFIERRPPRG